MFKRMIYLGVTVVCITILPSLTGLADPLAPAAAQGLLLDEIHRMVPADSDCTYAVALGDVDGDGDLDAFVGNFGNPIRQTRLYLNDGAGVFTDATSQLPVDSDNTGAVALGDVDGDGDLDAFIGNMTLNRLYLNNGAGFFMDASSQIPSDSDFTEAVALGDVDGDSDLDAFIGNGGQDRLYLNDGTGFFMDASSQIPSDSDLTEAVALGDVDGDGDLDAFIGNGGQDRLYLNDGTGVFTDASTQIPANSDETRAVDLGDVDGDGDLDAFFGNKSQDFLYLNDGTGFFADATNQIPVDDDDTCSMALGDVDGDGDLDVFIGNVGFPAAQNRLYLNDGAGFFSDATHQIPIHDHSILAVALGDVDGDGDLDAVIGTGSLGERNSLYLNDGNGAFTEAAFQLPVDSENTTSVSLGDVDGDGDLDAFIGNGADFDEQNSLYLNNGAGIFFNATDQIPNAEEPTRVVTLGDVDGDGDLDAFIGNKYSSSGITKHLYLNNGSGFFTDATHQIPAHYGTTNAIALCDVDGDGDIDAMIGQDGYNRLYLNDGAGFFTDATKQIPIIDDCTIGGAVGDVDGDNDPDVFIANDGYNRLYINDGSGFFTDATHQIPSYDDYSTSTALGDVDGDGDLDAFIGNYGNSTYQNRLYLNDGGGFFTDATHQIPIINDYTGALALGDLDKDGDLDAIIGNSFQNRLYLNDGKGFFSDAAARIPSDADITTAVALGDVDGDGDLDTFMGNFYKNNRLYTNLTRQLAWRGLPRIGKPLAMDLYGPANGTYVLAASRAQDSVPMPPYGTLRIDLGQVFYQGKGNLDNEGRASVVFDVPPNPNLNGMSFYFQALVGPPDKLTNLEIATVTNL